MRTVRNIVNTGRTIVCTIHQPSIDIFEAFDELLLLKRGGELIFNGQLGDKSGHLVRYFSVSSPGSTSLTVEFGVVEDGPHNILKLLANSTLLNGLLFGGMRRPCWWEDCFTG